jgi:hypothetical protein
MLYKRQEAIDTKMPGTEVGNMAGNTAVGIVSTINPLVGMAMQAGRMVSKSLPKDEFGNYKNDFTAGLAGGLDPFANIDASMNYFKDGDIGKGLNGLLNPIGAQVMINRDRKEEVQDILDSPFSKSFEVGAYNKLAGKMGGEGIDVNKTITDRNLNVTGAPGGVTATDATLLASSAISSANAGKFGFLKGKQNIDINSDIKVPESAEQILGVRDIDAELDMNEETLLNDLAQQRQNSIFKFNSTPTALNPKMNTRLDIHNNLKNYYDSKNNITPLFETKKFDKEIMNNNQLDGYNTNIQKKNLFQYNTHYLNS